MRRILVATGDSDHEGARLAVEITAKFDAEFLILHVATDNPLSARERGMICRSVRGLHRGPRFITVLRGRTYDTSARLP